MNQCAMYQYEIIQSYCNIAHCALIHFALTLAFSSKIRRYLPPVFCFPLYYWIGNFIDREPFFCPVNQIEDLVVSTGLFQFCIALALFYPALSNFRIGIYGQRWFILGFEHGQRVNESQKLSNVVGAIFKRANMK